MIINCLASGSSANCFIVTNSLGEILFLDAGVKFKKVLAHKRFTSCHKAVGVLVTHHHADHSLAVRDFFKAGIRTYTYDNLESKKRYRVGEGYEVIPFICPHDGIKNYGYVVKDLTSNKTLVYATDTTALPIIDGVDYWLVECNYNKKKWEENIATADNLHYFGRVLKSHMSLEYLVNYFSNGVKGTSKAIILCHLSENGNADVGAMRTALEPFAEQIDIAINGKEWAFK